MFLANPDDREVRIVEQIFDEIPWVVAVHLAHPRPGDTEMPVTRHYVRECPS
jgi:hypothetical protein